MGQLIVDWSAGLGLGMGYDSRTKTVTGSACVTTLPTVSETASGLDGYDFSCRVIESSEDLAAELGISASAAVTWGPASGSAKTDYLKSTHRNNSSVYAIVRIVLNLGSRCIAASEVQAIGINPTVIDELKKDTLRFVKNYGDYYVAGWTLGGEFFAVLQVSTSSEGEKQTIAGEISGAYNEAGAKVEASAKIASSLENLSKSRNLQFQVLQSGGDAPTWKALDFAEVMSEADAFVKSAQNTPHKYKAVIFPYSGLTSIQESNVDFTSVDIAGKNIEVLAKIELQRQDLVARLAYTSDNAGQFPFLNKTRLGKFLEDARKWESVIQNKAIYIEANKQDFYRDKTDYLENLKIDQEFDEALKFIPERIRSLPKSATDLAKIYRNPANGTYTIYLDGQYSCPVDLYCTFTNGKCLSYITLAAPRDKNMSWWKISTIGEDNFRRWRAGYDIKTYYEKIAIDPITRIVDLTDRTFATTEGGPMLLRYANESSHEIQHADYATAEGGNYRDDRTPFSDFWMDLTGTQWAIDDSVTWAPYNTGVKSVMNPLDSGRQTASGSAAGAHGGIRPSPNLKLKYKPTNA